MSKFINYNSAECQAVKEVFEEIPMMDTYVSNIVEEYIYSTVREYYKNGSLKCEYRTKYGEKDGEYKEWYRGEDNLECGHRMVKSNYVDGKLHGEHKEWYKNGKLFVQTTFVNDKFHGEYKQWHKNGKICEQTTYVDGKRHGEYKQWRENGELLIQYPSVVGD